MGGTTFWRIKPKLHMMQELGEYQVFNLGNPRCSWNYRDEDFVGWVADLAKCQGGPKFAVTIARKVVDRYRALK